MKSTHPTAMNELDLCDKLVQHAIINLDLVFENPIRYDT